MTERDYSGYTLSELREALSTVDGNKYPENEAALEAEMQKRIESGEVGREKQEQERQQHEKEQGLRRFARGALPWIGLYLLGGPLILLNTGTEMPEAFGWVAYAIWGLAIIYVGVGVVAGYGLWKRKNWGRRLAIGVFAMQVIYFQSGFMKYSLVSALSGFFYIAGNDGVEFGISFYLTTGEFLFGVGDLPLPFRFGLNLFAILMIWCLLKARQPLDGEESGIDTHPEEAADRPDLRP